MIAPPDRLIGGPNPERGTNPELRPLGARPRSRVTRSDRASRRKSAAVSYCDERLVYAARPAETNRLPVRVKMRNPRNEDMFSALPPKADIPYASHWAVAIADDLLDQPDDAAAVPGVLDARERLG
jgi:hypothetical protein